MVCVGAAAPIIFSSAPVTSGSLLLFVILHVVNSIETMTANVSTYVRGISTSTYIT